MDDFWPQPKKKKPEQTQKATKKIISLDGIKLQKKKTISTCAVQPAKPNKKFHFWMVTLILIIAFSSITLSAFFVARAAQEKLSILQPIANGKYLVLFQNNAEMRPSGGFMGSFAVVEIANYKLKNISFNTNIYKLDHNYIANHHISAPRPISLINDHWSLLDSNLAVSFPEAAQQIEWFYKQETDESVDGVIAINASVLADLLKITGPIYLENTNTTINSENFFVTMTTEIEKNYFTDETNKATNEPKSIIKDLFPLVINKLSKENKINLAKFVLDEMNRKQILLYSNDSRLQNVILSKNYGGVVQLSESDYLHINNANIGGLKSSLSIIESLIYKVTDTGTNLQGNLTVTRTHIGTSTWPDGVNKNYMKVMAPLNSQLKSITLNGADVSTQVEKGTEAGKTYFALMLQTAPKTTDVIELKYALPIKSDNYYLIVQKQSGNLGDELKVEFNDQLLFEGKLNTDLTIKS